MISGSIKAHCMNPIHDILYTNISYKMFAIADETIAHSYAHSLFNLHP